jgi:hypothetical protein
MFAFSVIWLLLAVTVTVLAITRRPLAIRQQSPVRETNDSGKAMALLAAIYGLALFAGFLYLSKLLVSTL